MVGNCSVQLALLAGSLEVVGANAFHPASLKSFLATINAQDSEGEFSSIDDLRLQYLNRRSR